MNRFQSLYRFLFHRRFLACLALLLVAACGNSEKQAMRYGEAAQQQLEAGAIAAARLSIQRAIKEDDSIAQLHILRGRIEFSARSPAGAFDAYSDALSLDAMNVEALQGVAQFGLQTGHLREAQDAADRILALNPGDQNGLVTTGLLQVVQKRTAQAIQTADKILAADPGSEGGTILKARSLFIQGQNKEAMEVVAKARSISGPSEGLSMTLLELYRETGNSAGMLEEFAQLRKFRPKDLDLRLDEANLLYKLGQTGDARNLLYATAQSPQIYADQARKMAEIIREYDVAPFTDAQMGSLAAKAPSEMKNELARFYLDMGQPEKLDVLLSGGSSIDSRALKARAAVAFNQNDQALAVANAVLEKDKTQCDAMLARSEAYLKQGKTEPAIIDAQSAQSQCPQILAGWMALARSYQARQSPTEVRRVFEQAIRKNPQNTYLSANFVGWLMSRNESGRALSVAQRLVRMAPALDSGWALYGKTCAAISGSGCEGEANAGLAAAKRILGRDLAPGEKPPNGLFGRLRRL